MNKLLFAILTVFLLAAGSNAVANGPHGNGHGGPAVKTDVSAETFFDPFAGIGEIVYPGIVSCPSEVPTGNPMQPCPDGSRIHIRDFTIIERVDSPDPRFSGWDTVVINSNWQPDGTGSSWGTFSLALDGDNGTWDGTWEGRRRFENGMWISRLRFSGLGTGGTIDGMKAMAVGRLESVTLLPFSYYMTIEGRIIDPNNRN